LEHIAGHLANALGDGPSVHGFERDYFQDKHVQGALHQVCRLAQAISSQ
jgi:hypothetical protein